MTDTNVSINSVEVQKNAGNSLVVCLIKAPLRNRDVFMKVFHAALL